MSYIRMSNVDVTVLPTACLRAHSVVERSEVHISVIRGRLVLEHWRMFF